MSTSSSSSSYSINSSTSSSGKTRITGLYSSMDIDSLVKSSLTNEQSKIDKVKQSIQYDEWKQEAYRAVNTALATFQDSFLNDTNATSSIASGTYMNAKTTTLSGTNTSGISVTATSDVQMDELTIDSFTKATKAHMESTVIPVDAGTTVPEMTISALITKTGATPTYTVKDGKNYVDFSINGKDFSMSTDATVSDMMKTINNTTGIGAKIYYSTFSGKFEMDSTSTGESSNFSITDTSGILVGAAGVFGVGDGSGKVQTAGTAGAAKNATIVVEGKTLSFESNSFSVDGYNFNISADSTSAVNVKSTTDTDSIFNRITSFVKAYNTLVTSISSQLTEKKNLTYKPLTDAQKSDMTETTIAQWETKAKAGILRSDSDLSNLMSTVRGLINTQTSSSGLNLASIGITTGTYKTCPNGQLVIDEDKLKNAIQNNSGAVSDLFTKTAQFGTAESKYNSSGLIYKMDSLITKYTKNSTDVTLANLTKDITSLTDRRDSLQDLFSDKEDKLYSKYSALETALSQMNSSTAFLSNS